MVDFMIGEGIYSSSSILANVVWFFSLAATKMFCWSPDDVPWLNMADAVVQQLLHKQHNPNRFFFQLNLLVYGAGPDALAMAKTWFRCGMMLVFPQQRPHNASRCRHCLDDPRTVKADHLIWIDIQSWMGCSNLGCVSPPPSSALSSSLVVGVFST